MEKQYIMTREEREGAIVALEACKKHLWNGRGHYPHDAEQKAAPICYAISIADGLTMPQRVAAENLITRSLNGSIYYGAWLFRHGIDVPNDEFLQQQRKRWVNHLIKALKKSLK